MQENNIILGLNILHPDASACLYIGNKLVGAVAEERLGKRIKHDFSFPIESIRYLLKEAELKVKDIDYVAVSRDPASNYLGKFKSLLKSDRNKINAIIKFFHRKKLASHAFKDLSSLVGFKDDKNNYEVVKVEHHLSHIAASYFTSSFDKSAAMSFDGSGDGVTVMFAQCLGNKIKILDRMFLPSSLGHFYTAMCQIIGFKGFGEEYKVMGLAPYGEDLYSNKLTEVIKIDKENGIFELNSTFFRVGKAYDELGVSESGELKLGNLYTAELLKLLQINGPDASKGSSKFSQDLAKSTQVLFEQASLVMLNQLGKLSNTDSLCLGGGCALNGVLNAKIPLMTKFKNTHHHPAASDDGNAIGAALYVKHHIMGQKRSNEIFSPYTGPSYNNDEIMTAIKNKSLDFDQFQDTEKLLDIASDFILDGKVIGWFQGKAEWGPRALGNRSILANPAHPNMKQIINTKIKKRESFRPFAPSVLAEMVSEYFEYEQRSPYMMHVVPLKQKYRKLLPSITHIDGTGRLQTVDSQLNPRYHELIMAVRKKTGFGIVLNTSFNENEPIVTTPENALDCFLRTDIDALFLNNFFIGK